MIIRMIKIEVKIGKVECISERVNLLTELPRLITLKSMPPPGLLFQKPILMLSKNQFLHRENFVLRTMSLTLFVLLIILSLTEDTLLGLQL